MKRPVKKVRRFNDGGYAGDDPIVKYRMGQLSEADTYDALGQKDLANASRAKEPTPAPKPTVTEFSEETGNKGTAAPKIVSSTPTHSFFRTRVGEKPPASDIEAMRNNVAIAKTAKDAKVSDREIAENKAKREVKPKVTNPVKTNSKSKSDSSKDYIKLDYSSDTPVKNVSPELDPGAYKHIKKPDLENGPIRKITNPVKELPNPIKGPKELPKFIKESNKDTARFNETVRKSKEVKEPEVQSNAMKRGGKVAGKLATRGYGKAR